MIGYYAEATGALLGGLANGFCGISSNISPQPGSCVENMMYLSKLDPDATKSIFCKEYGGDGDACSIDVQNDPHFGLDKDPTRCGIDAAPRVFFLWDEPGTHGSGHCNGQGLPACPIWAAETWKQYVDKWESELADARSKGMQVASPRFQGGMVLNKFAAFFQACPECSQKGSKYYIDILAFNAWVMNPQHNNGAMAGNVAWIKRLAVSLKAKYANRPVILADFGSLGAQSAALQADLIDHSGLFARGASSLDAIYYFAAIDYGGGTKQNGLQKVVESGPHQGATLGKVLLEKCQPYAY